MQPREQYNLLILRARAQYAAGRFAETQQSLDEASALGIAPTPEWEVVQAIAFNTASRGAEAVELLKRAVVRMAGRSADDEWANSARMRLADSLRLANDHAGALAVLEQTIAWQRNTLKSDNPRIALTRIQAVIQKRLLGRLDESLADALQVHADVIEAYGRESPIAAKSGMIVGSAYFSLKQLDDASRAYRESFSVFRNSLGASHPNTVRAAFNLAEVLSSRGSTRDEALGLYQLALDGGAARYGAGSNPAILFRNRLARELLADGQVARALLLLTPPQFSIAEATVGPENRKTYFELLGSAHWRAGCEEAGAQPSVALGNGSPAACQAARLVLDLADDALRAGESPRQADK